MQATVNTLRQILGNGRFATITFQKVDGSIRRLNGRVGVSKNVNGNGSTSPYVVKVYDVQKDENGKVKGWRTVKPEKVMQIVANKAIYNFVMGESKEEFINDVRRIGNILVVKMNGKDVYHFFNVPLETMKNFAVADSRGKFFNENIKDKYLYEKVK